MAAKTGDYFRTPVVRQLELAAGTRCCAPSCREPTTGGSEVIRIGEAAHITAAAKKGPRYDERLSSEERASVGNGIWLCKDHARLIDVDVKRHTAELLHEWKRLGEMAPLADLRGASQKYDLPNYSSPVGVKDESTKGPRPAGDLLREITSWSQDVGLEKAWGVRHGEAVEALFAELLFNLADHSPGCGSIAHITTGASEVSLSLDPPF